MLNELCKHGLVKHTMHLIGINSRTTLSQTTYSNLIGLLAKLAAGSSDAVTMIFELEIGSIMKDILSNYELSHGMLFPHAVEKQSNQDLWNSDKSDGVEGESAQRCRARLERHRRTVDRVAKALAEKNMRDLIAQREQAERNRFAETLDADIKRWSNGKEGNLRALLSTLQYILGHDCGWQSIPLTEVITSAAVKKAYRKATLCVHPDKLQQRGATIQQKYICEKVFDLLKDAWNRFNSEER